MRKVIVVEVFYVTALASSGLSAAEYRQICRILRGRFRNRLKEALPQLVARYRSLERVRVKFSN